MEIKTIDLKWARDGNIIIGQSHFIKTIEDLAEIMVTSVPGGKFGAAFCEASGPCLIRTEGNDPALIQDAVNCAKAVGAGHTFYLVLGGGTYPINVLNQVKACQEVARIFCATANPLKVVVAASEQGNGIVGVIDGFAPKGVETDEDKANRKAFLRKIGYKF
ncbi:MAG: adenosine-specific kinase [Spirochaetales bacterium]|nr:adenosine-specific kinase [Spirochaetales bacterium]